MTATLRCKTALGLWPGVFSFLILGALAAASGQDVRLGEEDVIRWRIGVEVKATGALTGGVATMVVPMDWPEQTVKIVDEDVAKQALKPTFKDLPGARMMTVTFPKLNAGDEARVALTFEIAKREIDAPEETDGLKTPDKPNRDTQPYLGLSPFIETNDPQIKAKAKEAAAEGAEGWAKVEGLYDWVREHVAYKFDPQIRPAKDALAAGHGDCEELTSLFIAFCRNHNIPARSVWVPGHCYPEFYLVDAYGNGHWYPCQAAGDKQFGRMHEARPILLKGDSFKLPDQPKPLRYVQQTFRAKSAASDPMVKFILEKAE